MSKSKNTTAPKLNEEIADLADRLIDLEQQLLETTKQLRKIKVGGKKKKNAIITESDEPTTEKKSRSAWQEWNSFCTTRFAADYAKHLEDVGKKSDAITFASKCRSSIHVDEWNEHEATWNAAHPKVEKPKKSSKSSKAAAAAPDTVETEEEAVIISNSAAASLPTATPAPSAKSKKPAKKTAPDSEDEAPKKKTAKKAAADSEDEAPKKKTVKKAAADSEDEAPKKKTAKKAADSEDEGSVKKTKSVKNAAIDSSDEEGSVKKAKRLTKEEKAAAKATATAAAMAAATTEPPTPWKYRGKDYLKNESNQVWQTGPEGEVGDWVGTFDGKKLEKSEGPA